MKAIPTFATMLLALKARVVAEDKEEDDAFAPALHAVLAAVEVREEVRVKVVITMIDGRR